MIAIVPIGPESTSGVPDVARPYSFKMADNSMSPRYRPGETICVDPALPPKVGGDCVFINNQRQALVGELLEMTTPEMWRIGQWRGSADVDNMAIVELPVSEWPLCHCITGARYR